MSSDRRVGWVRAKELNRRTAISVNLNVETIVSVFPGAFGDGKEDGVVYKKTTGLGDDFHLYRKLD